MRGCGAKSALESDSGPEKPTSSKVRAVISYNGRNLQCLFMLISYRTCHSVHYIDKPTLLVSFRRALVDSSLYATDRFNRFEIW